VTGLKGHIEWLRANLDQREIGAFFRAGSRLLESFDPDDDPEWDLLADQLDAFWYALDYDSR
jgi:hypothetical protein